MDLLILVTLVFAFFYSRRATSAEISEALGSRDSLIASLRNEIKDRFDQVVDHSAKAARSVDEMKISAKDVENAIRDSGILPSEHLLLLEDVLKITKNLDDRAKLQREQCNSNRESIDALDVDKRTLGYFEALDALNSKMERVEKQLGENKRLIAELKQDAARPPIGALDSNSLPGARPPIGPHLSIVPPELSPDAQPEPYNHDDLAK